MATSVIFALRRRGVGVTAEDGAICLAMILAQPTWTAGDVTSVFQSVLAKRPADAAIIADVWRDHLDMPPPGKEPAKTTKPTDDSVQGRNFATKLRDDLYRSIRFLGRKWKTLVSRALLVLLAIIVVVEHRLLLSWLAETLSQIVSSWCSLLPSACPVPRERSVDDQVVEQANPLLTIAIGIVLATALTAAAVAWGRRSLPGGPAGGERDADPPPPPPAKRELDATVFRVGLVGGEPPTFLGEPFRSDIAALFGYRPAGPDPSMVDVPGSIEAQIREADPSLLRFAVRRELPAILTLIDSQAEGATWNTLQPEFEALLRQRGIREVQIAFPGSFHRGLSRAAAPRAEALAVMEAIASPGWTVTVVFGEAHRMSPRDRDLLAAVRENGPLVFLEMRDPALWDGRHDKLTASGIDIRPATAQGLRDGLARIFAPHRGTPHGAAGKRGAAAWTLDAACRDWASDCSLVEPVSFALAETLRRRYEALRSPLPDLSFSRLAALPGSWIGPEGLRFEPSVRRALQSHFTSRDRAERETTVHLIERAFAQARSATLGGGAQTMHDYALNVARLIGLTSDTAWRAVDDLRRSDLMAGGLVEDLFARIRPEADRRQSRRQDVNPIGGRETILLAEEPETAAMRDWLASGTQGALRSDAAEAPERRLARWTMSVPDTRLVFEPAEAVPDQAGAAIPLAGFVAGGRYLLVASPWPVLGRRLHMLDLVTTASVPLEETASGRDFTAVVTARDALVAVIVDAAGAIHVVAPEESSGPPRFSATIRAEIGMTGGRAMPAVALSPDGRVLWAARSGRLTRAWIGPPADVDLARPDLFTQVEGQAPITAIHAESNQVLLLGHSDGTIVRRRLDSGASQEIARLDDAVVALSGGAPQDLPEADSAATGDLMAAATARGSLVLLDRRSRVEYRLRGVPRRIALFRDRSTVVRADPDAPSGLAERGVSIAASFEDGGFDIYGLPDPSQPSLFVPVSLLDGRILPDAGPAARAIAFGSQTRRVALYERGRIVVRSLVYRRPVASEIPGDEAGLDDDFAAAAPSGRAPAPQPASAESF